MNPINSNLNGFHNKTTSKEQTLMNTSTERQATSKPTLIDASSLSAFFIDVTEYIYNKQHGDRGSITAQDIVLHIMSNSAPHDSDLLKAYSGMIDMMADLGWIEIHTIGTTFDDELLYEFNPIKQGEIDA